MGRSNSDYELAVTVIYVQFGDTVFDRMCVKSAECLRPRFSEVVTVSINDSGCNSIDTVKLVVRPENVLKRDDIALRDPR